MKETNKMQNVYAALLLHKAGKDVNEENLKKVVVAAGVDADESQLKSLVASLKGVDIDKELASASLVAAAPVGSAPVEVKKEAKPKDTLKGTSEKKEAAAEGLSALFG